MDLFDQFSNISAVAVLSFHHFILIKLKILKYYKHNLKNGQENTVD